LRRQPAGKRAPTLFPSRPLTRNLWLIVWLAIVIAAAQISLFARPAVGVYVNAAALICLLGLALWQARARQLIISVAIIPIAMMVGLSLPNLPAFQRTMVVTIVVLLLGLTYQYLFTLDYPLQGTKQNLTKFGYALSIPIMVVVGQLIGLIAFAAMHGHYEYRGTSVLLVGLSLVVMAIAEEIVFRGLIEQRALLFFHPLMALVLTAFLYTLATLGHGGGIFAPMLGALIGVATSYVYFRNQNILLTITLNASAKLTFVGLVVIFTR
jgi:membrane protease YdiL (CAAX protease family)